MSTENSAMADGARVLSDPRSSRRADRPRGPKAERFALAAAALLAATAWFVADDGSALAAGAGAVEASVSVEPSTIAAGGLVVVAGNGLASESDRAIVLVGEGVTVELGSVKTDERGAFEVEFAVPSHVPPGTYALRTLGDRAAAQLTVTAGAVSAGSVGRDVGVPSMALTNLILLATAGIILVATGVFAWRAERIDRQPRARSS